MKIAKLKLLQIKIYENNLRENDGVSGVRNLFAMT